MVLLRALGWILLAMAVAAIVNDCLAWWSQGIAAGADRWDLRALRATAVLLLLVVWDRRVRSKKRKKRNDQAAGK